MPEKRFHRGDRVRFHFVNRKLEGRVKEDRGPIGVQGRRLYRIEFRTDREQPSEVELPAEQLESVH
jgi:hypothetical protein